MIQTFVKYDRTALAPGRARSEVNRALKATWHEMGEHWFTEFRPKHFKLAGAREYQYQARTKRYRKRKKREKGHTLPLVWSGRSRALSRIANITSTSKGVRVSMQTNQLNSRPHPTSPNMAQELRTISRREQREITRLFQERIEEKLNNSDARTSVRI